MAGQTPNYGIRFPSMTDPANIDVVQHIAEDSEAQLGILLDEVVSESSDKVIWDTVPWTPTVIGMTLGNGTITGKAFRLGSLVWVDFEILPNPTATPTTAWIANTFPSVAMPPSMPVSQQIIPAGHSLAAAKIALASPAVLNMATELAPDTNSAAILAIEGPMRIYNYPSATQGVSPWGNGDYVRCGLMYLTSAIVSE